MQAIINVSIAGTNERRAGIDALTDTSTKHIHALVTGINLLIDAVFAVTHAPSTGFNALVDA